MRRVTQLSAFVGPCRDSTAVEIASSACLKFVGSSRTLSARSILDWLEKITAHFNVEPQWLFGIRLSIQTQETMRFGFDLVRRPAKPDLFLRPNAPRFLFALGLHAPMMCTSILWTLQLKVWQRLINSLPGKDTPAGIHTWRYFHWHFFPYVSRGHLRSATPETTLISEALRHFAPMSRGYVGAEEGNYMQPWALLATDASGRLGIMPKASSLAHVYANLTTELPALPNRRGREFAPRSVKRDELNSALLEEGREAAARGKRELDATAGRM